MRTTDVPDSRRTAFSLLQVADAMEEAKSAQKGHRKEGDEMSNFMRQLEEEQHSILGLVRDSLSDLATIASSDSSEIPFDERSICLLTLTLSSSLDKSATSADDEAGSESRDDAPDCNSFRRESSTWGRRLEALTISSISEDAVAESRDDFLDGRLCRQSSHKDRKVEAGRGMMETTDSKTQVLTHQSLGPHLFSKIHATHDHQDVIKEIALPVSLCSSTESVSDMSDRPQLVSGSGARHRYDHIVQNVSSAASDDSDDMIDKLRDSAESVIDEQEMCTPRASNGNGPSSAGSFADAIRQSLPSSVATLETSQAQPPQSVSYHPEPTPKPSSRPPRASMKSTNSMTQNKTFHRQEIEHVPSKDRIDQGVVAFSYSESTKDSIDEPTPSSSYTEQDKESVGTNQESVIPSVIAASTAAPQPQSQEQEQMLKECYAAIISLKQTSETKYEMLESKYLELKDNFSNIETHNQTRLEDETHNQTRPKYKSKVMPDEVADNNCELNKYALLETRHVELTNIISQLEAKNQQLLEDGTRTAEQHLELKESYLQLETQHEKLTDIDDKYVDLQESYSELEARNNQLEMEVQLSERLEERCESVETKCVELQMSFVQLENQNQSLKEENAAFHFRHQKMESKYLDLEESNNQLKARNLKLEDMNDSLKAMQTSLEASLKSSREEIKVQTHPGGGLRCRTNNEVDSSNYMQSSPSENDLLDFAEQLERGLSGDSEQAKESQPPRSGSEETIMESVESTGDDKGAAQRQSASTLLNPWGNSQSSRLSSPRPPLPPIMSSPRRQGNPSWHFEKRDDADLVETVEDVSSSESSSSCDDSSTQTPEDIPELLPSPRNGGKPKQTPSSILEEILREAEETEEPLEPFAMRDVALADSDELVSPGSADPEHENRVGKPASTLEMMARALTGGRAPDGQAIQYGAMVLYGSKSGEMSLIPNKNEGEEGRDSPPLNDPCPQEISFTQDSDDSAGGETNSIMSSGSTHVKDSPKSPGRKAKRSNPRHQDEKPAVATTKKRDPCDCFMPLELEPPEPETEETPQAQDLPLTAKKANIGLRYDPCGINALQEALTPTSCTSALARRTWNFGKKQQNRAALMSSEQSVVTVSTVHSVDTTVMAAKTGATASFESTTSSDNGSTISSKVRNSKSLRAKLRRKHGADGQKFVQTASSSSSGSYQSQKAVLRADKKIPLQPPSGGGLFSFL